MMVFAGRVVCLWKYVVGEDEPPRPSPGGPGKGAFELAVNCLRLHTAIGEQASAGDESSPCLIALDRRCVRRGSVWNIDLDNSILMLPHQSRRMNG